ncbi:MAG: hypothetical protein CMQ34_02850 [Gammaproteobacteria bacterium]|nr:hypothetical protein [Gammaproteobacteria bacterium]|tara:strand:+ start:3060 stop:3437 length:378 start_codon:yes stop_codon:yes gene_type:complete
MTNKTLANVIGLEKELHTQSGLEEELPNEKYYPKAVSPKENYWYLTESGWIPWKDMDFTQMRVGLNIYMVVYSYFSPFLDPGSFTGSSRPLWTADQTSGDFVHTADKLIREYGAMPEGSNIFHAQ